jgi:hypothetical protein
MLTCAMLLYVNATLPSSVHLFGSFYLNRGRLSYNMKILGGDFNFATLEPDRSFSAIARNGLWYEDGSGTQRYSTTDWAVHNVILSILTIYNAHLMTSFVRWPVATFAPKSLAQLCLLYHSIYYSVPVLSARSDEMLAPWPCLWQ